MSSEIQYCPVYVTAELPSEQFLDGTKRHSVLEWDWGHLCDTPGAAGEVIQARLAAGGAVMGFVVAMKDGQGRMIDEAVWPESARRAVLHYWDVAEACIHYSEHSRDAADRKADRKAGLHKQLAMLKEREAALRSELVRLEG
jgi:hypothetical protein